MAPPSGTVTFLFTDIEGSTRLWERSPDLMPSAHARHEAILRATMAAHGGYVYKMIGDALQVAFASAPAALAAALAAQRALQAEPWGDIGAIRVRMALHTGETEERGDDYVGPLLNRVARLLSVAYGNQVLLTQATAVLGGDHLPPAVQLRNLGEYRLRDLVRPEQIYQLVAPDLASDFPPLKALAHPNNLPLALTRFIGREREIAAIKQRLARVAPDAPPRARLLTLTGPGGVGKTRLAIQAAADLMDDFPDGTWLAELAALTDSALLPQTVASVLGVHEESGHSLLDTLVEHVRDKELLLILDNCEQLIAPAAALAERLLQAGPGLVMLATGREALGLTGEVVFRVPSLNLPDLRRATGRAELVQSAAVQLFVDRAAAARSDFALTEANASAVAQICVRLDGIPLAIELAATCVKSLTADKIGARLDDRFRLLTHGSRTALPRQQTLRALIDWSYDLLSEPERILLRRLSVFAGGWSLEAAEQVCGGEPDPVFDLLAHLVDQSLVNVDERDDETRYFLLETIREYAAEKLRAAGEDSTVSTRHASFFLRLAEETEPHLLLSERKEWLARLESELDNFRIALAFLLGANPPLALKLVTVLVRYWDTRGYFGEARKALQRAYQAAPEASIAVRASALKWMAHLAMRQADLDKAQQCVTEALALSRIAGDDENTASTLGIGGLIQWSKGDYETANDLYLQALELYRELGDKRGIAGMLSNLGNVALAHGDYASARRMNEESLAAFRELGDQQGIALGLNNVGVVAERQQDWAAARASYEASLALSRHGGYGLAIAYALNSLGHVALQQGDYATARQTYRESLELFGDQGERRGVAYCFEGLGRLAVAEGRMERAARLYSAAACLRRIIGMPLIDAERVEAERDIDQLRALMGGTFGTSWAEASTWSYEQAIAFAGSET